MIESLIVSDVSMASLTSYRVGGLAQWYAAPGSPLELEQVLLMCKTQNLPLTVIGSGSNLLISDRGIKGLVLSTRKLRGYEFDLNKGEVSGVSGEPVARLAWQAAKRGLAGLEWAVGIPGTVGGAVVMNAGAHTSCVADSLVKAVVLSCDGEVKSLNNEDLSYGYRSSNLQKESDLVVTQATFKLQPGLSKKEVKEATTKYLHHRHTTQPYDKPSCGSVFRNPPGYAAGWLIEQTGLKGYRLGGAQVSERHANFIINCDHASAEDIFSLIRYVQQQVKAKWSITLEPEVKMLGDF